MLIIRITKNALKEPATKASISVLYLTNRWLVGTITDGTIFFMTGIFFVLSTQLLINRYSRFSVSPKVNREVAHHSGAPLSDSDIELSDSDDATQYVTPAKSKPSHSVSEPKHKKRRSNFVLPQLHPFLMLESSCSKRLLWIKRSLN